MKQNCIADIILPETICSLINSEQQAALEALKEDSHFQPLNDNLAPYKLSLSILENRLLIQMTNTEDKDLSVLVLSLKPYRRLIHDYFLILKSYEEARKTATYQKLEAIDMARRGLHNEGAELLAERLKDKIDMDFETARRIFTLIALLHQKDVKLIT